MNMNSHEIRTELIDKAAKFLLDEKVSRTGLDIQRQFLMNKGLTNEEIADAISKADEQRRILHASQEGQFPTTSYSQSSSTAYPKSRWIYYANSVVLAGGLAYMGVKVLKNYLLPQWFGIPTKDENRVQSVQDGILDVRNNLKFLVDSVQQTLVVVQQQQDVSNKLLAQLNSKEDNFRNLEKCVLDLRSEVSVVKNLLLSRDQFPPVPPHKPFKLPAWQHVGNGNSDANTSSAQVDYETEGDFRNGHVLNGHVDYDEDEEDDRSISVHLNADEKVTPV